MGIWSGYCIESFVRLKLISSNLRIRKERLQIASIHRPIQGNNILCIYLHPTSLEIRFSDEKQQVRIAKEGVEKGCFIDVEFFHIHSFTATTKALLRPAQNYS